MCACVCVCVCVCVQEREREREKEESYVGVCVFVCVRDSICASCVSSYIVYISATCDCLNLPLALVW